VLVRRVILLTALALVGCDNAHGSLSAGITDGVISVKVGASGSFQYITQYPFDAILDPAPTVRIDSRACGTSVNSPTVGAASNSGFAWVRTITVTGVSPTANCSLVISAVGFHYIYDPEFVDVVVTP
jgi:hypothetical protein